MSPHLIQTHWSLKHSKVLKTFLLDLLEIILTLPLKANKVLKNIPFPKPLLTTLYISVLTPDMSQQVHNVCPSELLSFFKKSAKILYFRPKMVFLGDENITLAQHDWSKSFLFIPEDDKYRILCINPATFIVIFQKIRENSSFFALGNIAGCRDCFYT